MRQNLEYDHDRGQGRYPVQEISAAWSNKSEIAANRPARQSRRPGKHDDLDQIDDDEVQWKPTVLLRIGQIVELSPVEPDDSAANDGGSQHEGEHNPSQRAPKSPWRRQLLVRDRCSGLALVPVDSLGDLVHRLHALFRENGPFRSRADGRD